MANEQLVEEGREGAGEMSAPKPPPAWGPPRAPLPPHRLAALANALGVSTPSPATQPSMSSSASYPGTSGSSSDHNWRSPTPSSSTHSLSSYSPSTSKFLLHVMPPLHLPHESNCDADDSELTPPPSNASGYHTQFRRGTLVPLHPTLHSQMVAIAKEYALPSTAGMILYLSSSSSAQPSPVDSFTDANGPEAEEPGPRLSEDIWKHLWSRVLKVEREENLAMSRGPTPNFGLGINLGLKNLSYSPQDIHGPLRPMFSPSLRGPTHQHSQTSVYPMSPAPSTPSSTSDLRSHSKSAAPSFSSRSLSADTAETSTGSHTDELEPDPRAEGLHLPGLNSPSLIPILAKVEFDIDRRKAGWYEPWLRSRKMNQLKRSEGRKGQSGSDEKAVPIQLKLARKVGQRGGFKPFSESPEHTDTELDDTFEGRLSRKIPPPLILPDDANDSGDAYLAYLKRDLGVYDDLEGLGEFSYDPHDPHDRRKSQYIMKTKLDEIEKTLAQFSPKHLDQNQSQTDLSNQQLPEPSKVPRSGSPLKQDGSSSGNESGSWPRRSTSLRAKHHTVRYENAQLSVQGKAKLNEEDVSFAPEWAEKPVEKPVDKTTSALRKKQYRNTFKLEGNTIIPRDSAEANAAYPPVPLSSRSTNGVSDPARSVNGISASASKPYIARTNSSDFNNVLASGSTIRRGGHQEEERLNTPATPVIPLSPDPFGRFASNSATPPLSYKSFASSDVTEDAASSSRFSTDSIANADSTRMPKGDKSGPSLTSVKGVKKLLKKSRLSISGRQSISLTSSNRPPLPRSPQEELDWPLTPRSPLPPQATSAPAVKHSRVDSANDHFHFDQESSYPVRQSFARVSKPSISEHPSSPPSTAPDRSSIRKSILKSWKPPPTQSQLQGSTLEPLAERSGDRPRLNPDESVARRQRRPSVLIATDASAPSNPDVRPRPQVQVQYINGRVAGLSDRRKSRPANVLPPSSTNSPHHSPPLITSPSLAAGASQPKPMTSRTSSKG